MSFCIKCGNRLEEKDLFCPNCGEKIKEGKGLKGTLSSEEDTVNRENTERQKNRVKSNKFKIAVIIGVLLIIGFSTGYALKDSFYAKYYTYKADKALDSTDKLTFSSKALNYKLNETSLNNYENALKQNINNLSLVVTSLEENKKTISKNTYNSMMIDAYKVQLKKYIDSNNSGDTFKTFIELGKYGYNYRNDQSYKNVMLNLSNAATNNNAKGLEELSHNGIVIGDIDNDGIDEIVQLSQLTYMMGMISSNDGPNSYITAYKFKDNNFTKIDTLKIDRLNEGSQIFIGKPNKDITTLILDGYIGVHSGEANAYFMKENKLKQLISKKTINTYRVSPKDINNDGIVEFGILEMDPNSEDKSMAISDKIIIWFNVDAEGNTKEVKKEYIKGKDYDIGKYINVK